MQADRPKFVAEEVTDKVGRCGDRPPGVYGPPDDPCGLPAGHAGWHKNMWGEEWTGPVELEHNPVGLSVDQEIRARAAELYWNGSPGTWTLQDIVGWIRDGEVPTDV